MSLFWQHALIQSKLFDLYPQAMTSGSSPRPKYSQHPKHFHFNLPKPPKLNMSKTSLLGFSITWWVTLLFCEPQTWGQHKCAHPPTPSQSLSCLSNPKFDCALYASSQNVNLWWNLTDFLVFPLWITNTQKENILPSVSLTRCQGKLNFFFWISPRLSRLDFFFFSTWHKLGSSRKKEFQLETCLCHIGL